MQIKKRLQINFAISILTVLAICLVLFLSFHYFNKANNLENITSDLTTCILERAILRSDYSRNNTTRAKEQWIAKNKQIAGLLKSASGFSLNSEDRKNIGEMIEIHESIGEIFSAIVANREKNGFKSGATDLSREVEERLLNQLDIRVYEKTVLTRNLLNSSTTAQESSIKQSGIGLISILLIVTMAVIINSRTMGKVITERVAHLHKGALLIGGGDLNHLIDIKGDDEFSELSETFNEMTAKLCGSYHNLEMEIEERKQAEKALKESEEQIKASLAEKEVMLKEIHHRVKNNLQVISSLVGLQADGSQDEAVRQVLRDVTYRVRSMALVHEKLYQSADLAHIDFAEYTRSLLSYLWRAHGAIAADVRQTFDLEPVSLSVDTAVTCGLILNELAVNALEHAFQGRADGEVTVSLHSGADGRIRLSVSDNGVGLPAGFDWRQTRSLGLRLVQMLARQLDGDVAVSGEEGTAFTVTFSI
jgi:two-component sensor histidine kinase/HAMP domain-containing protein